MAKGLCVRFGEEESSFSISKIDREKLYGRKERIVVDEQGRGCSTAWLTSDGAALVPGGGAAYLYVDERFEAVERSALIGVDDAGNRVALCPSTLGIPQAAAEVDAARVLEHVVSSVYALHPDQLGANLAARLAAGAVVETAFNWREDYAMEIAFLIQNTEGIFALIGTPTRFSFIEREALPTIDAAAEESEDDLDFSMM